MVSYSSVHCNLAPLFLASGEAGHRVGSMWLKCVAHLLVGKRNIEQMSEGLWTGHTHQSTSRLFSSHPLPLTRPQLLKVPPPSKSALAYESIFWLNPWWHYCSSDPVNYEYFLILGKVSNTWALEEYFISKPHQSIIGSGCINLCLQLYEYWSIKGSHLDKRPIAYYSKHIHSW
jgi:hypothetical protein